MSDCGLTFRDDRERRAYEYCRDIMFPTLTRLKKKARKNMAEKEKAEKEAKQ